MDWTSLVSTCIRADEENAYSRSDIKTLAGAKHMINHPTTSGNYPLHFVALGRNVSLAEWLLDNGGAFYTNQDYQTPLHWACRAGYLPMVSLFLLHMTPNQITFQDEEGNSALDWAREYEHEDIINLLNEFATHMYNNKR